MALEMPKSVRQIGDCKGNRKIYIEDYVVSFAKQLAKRSEGKEIAGVLLGTNRSEQGVKYLFISGMVAIRQFAERTDQQFSQDIWGNIYTDIKENFTGLEILGWYYSGPGTPVSCNETLRVIHGKNFSGADKLLFIYDDAEKDEGFFRSTAGVMERQKGFYIYYEKNEEMRDYMVGYIDSKTSFEHVEDTALDIRNVLRAKKGLPIDSYIPEKTGFESKRNRESRERSKEGRYSVGLGTVIVVFAVLLGFVALQNQNAFRKAEEQISNIKETFQGETVKEPDKTEVERLQANLPATGAAVSVSSSAVSEQKDIQGEEKVPGQPMEQVDPAKRQDSDGEPKPVKTPGKKPESQPTPEPKPAPKPSPENISTPKPEPKKAEANTTPAFWNYIVRKGDTLSQIAQKYYRTVGYVEQIKKINGLSDADDIRIGQKLKMPN